MAEVDTREIDGGGEAEKKKTVMEGGQKVKDLSGVGRLRTQLRGWGQLGEDPYVRKQ